ncbi:peptidase E [Nonlabens dokdonensis]|uniref:Peptidase S51, dipeptidase E n=2 Tax=Nonlabens dokdonensis TaxID=328515 RepID=L7WAM5_NONDD|nr:peptidase E [Nonlabens dokdonensis]AGC77247.1 peptidase S51, dipeptidase E [Nonlabens dokdonensis DSW-6]PZX40782.1 peptidase E [Nonlabens dokdonensis]
MNRILLLLLFFSFNVALGEIDKKLFIYGGQVNKDFIAYTAKLTGKENPKICFLPTASGDSPYYINYWYEICSGLKIEPKVMEVWINSSSQNESFEEKLLKMDAIIVGGGNTLNMLAIWKAQKIDIALRKAYDKGIVIAGGSAGSLCWFNAGTTDSRPKKLSIVKGLGFLEFSHCPHYSSEKTRKPLYHKNILEKKLTNGYACDDNSGILFINGKAIKSLSTDAKSFSYYVYEKDGEIIEEKLIPEIIK